MKQSEALDLLKMGKNIFLTGEAGSGKTYLLNQFIKYLKDNDVQVAVTASTGIAATHLQGTTIHSWSGIGARESLTNKDLEKILLNKRVKRNYKKSKVLIIDEISMLHKHQFDMVDVIARYILNSNQAFGGMQIVLCGDFFQLPPVASSSILDEKLFAFEAAAWTEGKFEVCYLHEQHRQGNDPLLTVLNDIRSGTAGEHTKIHLRTRYKKEPHSASKATKLYTRNINVEHINDLELANIPQTEKIFTMTSDGFAILAEGLKKNCLAKEILKLKIGAEVMFIKNDMLEKYVNGTRGIVIGFEANDEAWPIVKTVDGKIITAYPQEWKYEDNGVIRAVISQVPLRLAWAITIHKSQGMTLDAAEIDLGDAFEPGMGYVALSRVRSLNGLKLMNLNEMALKVHPKILQHDSVFKSSSHSLVNYLQNLSTEEIEGLQNKILTQRLKDSTVKSRSRKTTHQIKQPKIPTHISTLEMLKENLSVETIATKRGITIATVIGHIEKLKGLNQVDETYISHLKDMIQQKDFNAIFAALKNSKDGKLKPIFEGFKGKYSYASIQLVRLFVI